MNYFTYKELECPCFRCKGKNTHEKFDKYTLRWLNYYRKKLGFPLPVTSGYRCKAHDTEIGGKGVHPKGTQVDISKRKMTARQKYKFIVAMAKSKVFTRLGLTYKNHYHIGTGKPKEVSW